MRSGGAGCAGCGAELAALAGKFDGDEDGSFGVEEARPDVPGGLSPAGRLRLDQSH